MAKIMDPILPILSILEYWAICFGFFGGPRLGRERSPGMGLPHEPRTLKSFGLVAIATGRMLRSLY